MRVALEQMEPEKDMDNFVKDYGTGSAIPDPPNFINYNSAEAVPAGSSRPTSRPAQFARNTQRHLPFKAPPPVQDDEPAVNMVGVGTLGRNGTDGAPTDGVPPPARSQSQSRASMANGLGGNPPANGQGAQVSRAATTVSRQTTAPYTSSPQNDASSDPTAPNEQYMLKVGNGAYKVDPSNDPQAQQVPTVARADNFADGEDPLAAKMNELRSQGSQSQRRNSTYRPEAPSQNSNGDSGRKPTRGGPALSPPSTSSASRADYRKSAEVVVGSYPGGGGVSRPVSPNPPAPTASMARPPEQNAPPSGMGDVESVLQSYGQAMPGERKSTGASRRGSFIGTPSNANIGQNIERAPSRDGHAGIGAHGVSRSPSPQPQPAQGSARRNSHISPAVTPASSIGRATSVRAPSTNSVGIALDPSGKVAVDAMADRYRQPPPQQQQQLPPQQQPPPSQQPSPSYNAPPASSRPTNHMNYPAAAPPPVQQPAYAPPPQPAYSQPQQAYNPPPQPQQQHFQQPAYAQPPPPAHYQPPAPAPTQPMYQQHGYSNSDSLSRATSNANNAGYGNSHLVSPQHPYGTGGRTPSPQPPQALQPSPTGAYTDDGRPILFYGERGYPASELILTIISFTVKALYDYGATIEEEFDFQSGDIIAVTATPEDGWWSGELLDEARRQPGRHVFPSNFVCLF